MSMFQTPYFKESISTEEDSSSERQQEIYSVKTNPVKHKTQLCKTFSQLGYCNYGRRCRFAHGRQQLVTVQANKHFRKKKCNGFWNNGMCLYGVRCQFDHAKLAWEDHLYMKTLAITSQSHFSNERSQKKSKLLQILCTTLCA